MTICIELVCNVRSSFNVKGEKKGLYCAQHKLEGMVNVLKPTCIECDVTPNFNVKGGKKALYCVQHKLDGMVNDTL